MQPTLPQSSQLNRVNIDLNQRVWSQICRICNKCFHREFVVWQLTRSIGPAQHRQTAGAPIRRKYRPGREGDNFRLNKRPDGAPRRDRQTGPASKGRKRMSATGYRQSTASPVRRFPNLSLRGCRSAGRCLRRYLWKHRTGILFHQLSNPAWIVPRCFHLSRPCAPAGSHRPPAMSLQKEF